MPQAMKRRSPALALLTAGALAGCGGGAGTDADTDGIIDAGDGDIDASGPGPDAAIPGGGGVGPRIDEFTPSGPIVLADGDEITGLHITSDDGPCISGSGVTSVLIHDNLIGPCGPTAEGVGVDLFGASDVRIDHNAFDDVAGGLYVNGQGGGGSDLVFDHNLVTRLRGPMPRGQIVQFNTVHGTGNQIVCNVSDQDLPGYLDGPEDHVNMFASAGTADSPILIAYNKLRGGGPSASGGGLLAGDFDSEYIDIVDNTLIAPGQYGIAIAGGRHFRVLDNRVFAPDPYEWSNVGLYVWNQTEEFECSGHEVRGNRVYYVNASDEPNPVWNAENCGPVDGWDDANTWGDETLTAAIWDEPFAPCE
jgi:hypothetical protein